MQSPKSPSLSGQILLLQQLGWELLSMFTGARQSPLLPQTPVLGVALPK